jgi:hypothetical protein
MTGRRFITCAGRALHQLLDGLRYFARGRKCRGMVLPSHDGRHR